jgi:hypothetical protein
VKTTVPAKTPPTRSTTSKAGHATLRPSAAGRGVAGGARALTLAGCLLAVGACEAAPQAVPDELRAAAERVLPRLQELAGLEARAPIALGVRSRGELRRFVEEKLAEEFPPEELAAVQATYTALGLLPEGLDLEALLLDLYSEQIVGFYDPARDTLYVVDDVPPAQLETVLVHELVHALQDQHADLEGLIDPALGGDRQSAAQAAIEGHATLVMVAYMLDSMGADPSALIALPDLTTQLGPALQATNFPVLSGAPRIIRDALLFPYFGGAGFAQELWRQAAAGSVAGAGQYPAPLGRLLPTSTEQVRRPAERFFPRPDAPTELRFGPAAEAGWPVLYENTLGELELSIILAEWLGEDAATLAYGWDGDRFLTMRTPSGGIALDLAVAWDDAAAAGRFAEAYRRASAARPARTVGVTRTSLDGVEVVRILDAPRGTDLAGAPSRELTLQAGVVPEGRSR